jgi:CHAT domain-containing protein
LAKENAHLLGALTGTLAQEDRAFFLLNKWTAEEEELAARINQLSRLKKELGAAPWHRRLGLRRHLHAQLEELLSIVDRYRDSTAQRMVRAPANAQRAAHGTRYKDLQNAPPPPARWRRLWRHKRRRALLSFLVLPDRVFAVRRTRFTLDFVVSRVTRIEVRELVRQWHEIVVQIIQARHTRGLGARPDSAPAPERADDAMLVKLEDKARQIAHRLSKALQLPSMLNSLPRTTRTLTLVADDSLHGFPFAAITHRGRYLIEQYALAFAYRSDDSEPQQQPRPSGAPRALLVGASRPAGKWPALPCVPEELNHLAYWAMQRKLSVQRFDDAAPEGFDAPDKTAVLTALPQASLAHVACHGIFKPDQPAQSGIVLRPAEQPDVLSVQELAALDLTRLRHVTLSACWSADHFILPGRWVISLPETLARAGAGSVLGCLWLVDDRVGMAFMAQFYRHLNTHPRAEALRRTQLDCLKGKLEGAQSPETAQPIFWAGYQLYGRGDALKL